MTKRNLVSNPIEESENTREGSGKLAPAQPLKTREAFLDTQAYRKVEFDLSNPTMAALFEHVDDGRLRLHTTDITLREVMRQLLQLADVAAREVSKARETLKRWKTRAPSTLADQKIRKAGLDGDKMGHELFKSFREKLRTKLTTEHLATARSALPIFKAYFDKKPPFDSENSKEFPDAFVIDVLEAWCDDNQTQMYIVTGDKAMLRAARASNHLIAVDDLANLLAIATMDHEPGVEDAVEKLVQLKNFTQDLAAAVDTSIGHLGIIYVGDLAEGAALDAERSGPCENLTWTVISSGPNRYGLIVEFDIQLTVEVEHEDRELAFYDREEGRYFGAENVTAEVVDDVGLKMFVEIDGGGSILRYDMLTRDVDVSDFDPY